MQEFPLSDQAVGLNARQGLLAIAYTNGIELRREIGLLQFTNLPASGLKDVAIAPDNLVWVIASNAVLRLEGPSGTSAASRGFEEAPATQAHSLCPDVAKPTAIAWSPGGQLIVCDDGPDQQVKFYDVSGERPKLARTFGDRGGLHSGVPGLSAPTKLYALRGAGMDAQGNLYVALGITAHRSARWSCARLPQTERYAGSWPIMRSWIRSASTLIPMAR